MKRVLHKLIEIELSGVAGARFCIRILDLTNLNKVTTGRTEGGAGSLTKKKEMTNVTP